MPSEVWTTLQAWLLTLLLYPGLLFGVLLALFGEWATAAVWSVLRRGPRPQARLRPFTYPLYNTLKLTGRGRPSNWPLPGGGASGVALPASQTAKAALGLMCVAGPVLALALLPFPDSPFVGVGSGGDLLVVLLLLAVQPMSVAVARLLSGDLTSIRGAQDIGRVVTGLLPALVSVAALVEVSGSRSLQLTGLMAAPETAAQTFVRVLAGGVLLLSLSWWATSTETFSQAYMGAGAHLGGLLQTAALAAFWSMIVLPAPGERIWAILVYVLGALFAYTGMRSYRRVSPATREKDVASFTWATALPVSAVALVMALLWPGA